MVVKVGGGFVGVNLEVLVTSALLDRLGGGSLVGVLGASGDEEDVLLRVVVEAGLFGADAGAVVASGGVVPVGSLVPRALRAGRAVDYAGELRLGDREPEVRRARVGEVMKLLGLESVADVRVSKLGVGEQVLLNVAVELLNGPNVLQVALEGAMLEPDQGRRIFEGLREVCKGEGVNVICMLEAAESDVFGAYCDVVYCLEGRDIVTWQGARR